MPTARAISSIGASCTPRSSNRARVAATRSRSRSRRVAAEGVIPHSVTQCVTMSYMEAATMTETPFSLELSEEQRDVRDWVHGFAEGVVRPAAAEWDEREETPWPIIGEAAKIGLYGFEALAQFFGDPTGLTLPIVNEELFWGDAGIGMAIMGSSLAVAGIFASGTPDQMMEWVPQCFGTPEDPKVGSFCVSEPDAGSDVSSLRTR